MDDARIYIEMRKLKLSGNLDLAAPQSPLSNLSRFDPKRREKIAIDELRNDEA